MTTVETMTEDNIVELKAEPKPHVEEEEENHQSSTDISEQQESTIPVQEQEAAAAAATTTTTITTTATTNSSSSSKSEESDSNKNNGMIEQASTITTTAACTSAIQQSARPSTATSTTIEPNQQNHNNDRDYINCSFVSDKIIVNQSEVIELGEPFVPPTVQASVSTITATTTTTTAAAAATTTTTTTATTTTTTTTSDNNNNNNNNNTTNNLNVNNTIITNMNDSNENSNMAQDNMLTEEEIRNIIYVSCETGDIYTLVKTVSKEIANRMESLPTPNSAFHFTDYFPDVKTPIELSEKAERATLNFIHPQTRLAPIHVATKNNHLECVSFLSRCATIDLNILTDDPEKQTALHLSVIFNFVNVCHVLLQRGANYNLENAKGETAMILAAKMGLSRESCSGLMVEYGADVSLMYDYSPFASNGEGIEEISAAAADYSEQQQKREFDPYGWLIESNYSVRFNVEDYVNSQKSRRAVKPNTPLIDKFRYSIWRKEKKREAKWGKMIRVSMEKKKKNPAFVHRKLKKRVRKGGIPNAVRGDAWILLTRSDEMKNENPGVYQQCLKQSSVHSKQIDLDVKRQFREHRMFMQRYGKGQVLLYNVLKAYSVYNPTLGYTQGMSILAALLLMYMGEEDAFWTLATIMKHPKYGMQGIFLDGLPKLNLIFYIHERLLAKHLGKLFKQFNTKIIHSSSYATRWYMQVMVGILPWDIALIFWDLFLSEGYKIVYSVVYSLMRLMEKELLNKDFEVIIMRLNQLDKMDFDVNKLLKLTIHDKIKEKKLKKYEREFNEKNKKQ